MCMQHSSNMHHTLNVSKVVTQSALVGYRHVEVVPTIIISIFLIVGAFPLCYWIFKKCFIQPQHNVSIWSIIHSFGYMFRFHQNKYWPEDGLIKPKHLAKTMYYWLYTDILLWLNKMLYKSGNSLCTLNTADKALCLVICRY